MSERVPDRMEPAAVDSAPAASLRSQGLSLRGERPYVLALILLAFAAMTLAFRANTPVGEGPDELTHLEMVWLLRRDGRLPVAPARAGEGPVQAKHPPLYYLLATLIHRGESAAAPNPVPNPHFAFNMEDLSIPNALLHARDENELPAFREAMRLRLLSLVAGLVVVLAAWLLAREVWPERDELWWGTAATVAMVPGFLFMSAIFSNDALANAASAMLLVAALRTAKGRVGTRDLLFAGLWLGVGLNTKLTVLPSAMILGLSAVVWLWRSRSPEDFGRILVFTWGLAGLLSGWWFLRNMRLYGWDDPLGWKRFGGRAEALARTTPLSEELGPYLGIQFQSFWGRFGWQSLPMEPWAYTLLRVFVAAAMIGLARALYRHRSAWGAERAWPLAVILAAIALGYATVFKLAFDFNLVVAHGRLLYPILPALMLVAVFGWTALWPRRWQPHAASIPPLMLAALSLVALNDRIVPAYALPAAQDVADLSEDVTATDVEFEGGLRLIGFAHDLAQAREPAEPASAEATPSARAKGFGRVRLYWQAPANLLGELGFERSALRVFAHVVGARTRMVARGGALPYAGRYPFVAWPEGEVHEQVIELEEMGGDAAGRRDLLIGVHVEDEPEDRLRARWREGEREVVSDAFMIPLPSRADDALTRSPRSADPRFRFDAGVEIRLLDVWVEARPEFVDLELLWEAVDRPLRDDTVFVHLTSPAGELVADADGQPMKGELPFTRWEPGMRQIDRRRIVLPEGLPPGRYLLSVGLYDLTSGERRGSHPGRSVGRLTEDGRAELTWIDLPLAP